MTWRRGTPNKTIAKNANTKANGANIERKEKSSSKSSAQLSPRKDLNPLSFLCRT